VKAMDGREGAEVEFPGRDAELVARACGAGGRERWDLLLDFARRLARAAGHPPVLYSPLLREVRGVSERRPRPPPAHPARVELVAGEFEARTGPYYYVTHGARRGPTAGLEDGSSSSAQARTGIGQAIEFDYCPCGA